jgi:asparagine synthase (glutamine-hydrolysing)
VIDRPKGYFPVPGLTRLEGPVLDLVRDALHAPAARDRGLFRRDRVDALLDDPNRHFTRVGGNVLWEIGCSRCGCSSTESGDGPGARAGTWTATATNV